MRLPRWLSGKESTCQCRRPRRWGFDPWVRKIPWRRKWQPTPVFLPGKFHGQSCRAGYSPKSWTRLNTAQSRSARVSKPRIRTSVLFSASLVAQMVKNLPTMQETWVWSPGWEDPLGVGMATHSSILAWKLHMDRGAWWAKVHGVTERQLSTAYHVFS